MLVFTIPGPANPIKQSALLSAFDKSPVIFSGFVFSAKIDLYLLLS